jgi:hypothetical protein
LPEDQDIAVLKFKASDQAFIKVSGKTTIEPGQKVVVIGAPLGLENTVSDGIVAALRQESDWIQITAPISPGSSGSPVFAEDGTLIGMATLSLVKGQQLNFAIPSRFVATAIEKARAYELLGDQDTAKEVSDKMHALIEQGELEYENGGRRYQGASRTRARWLKLTERSGSIDLKDGPYTWTFPTADREADTWTLPRAEKELPKVEGKSWFFDRNCALQLKGNWYFSENAVRGPILFSSCHDDNGTRVFIEPFRGRGTTPLPGYVAG